MNATRVADVIRSHAAVTSRRGVLGAVAGGALGIMTARLPTVVDARTGRRRRKSRPNAFGCRDVGKACAGRDARCCSGICTGKKPNKGERDRSRCVAHDSGGCQAGQDACGATGVSCVTSSGGADGLCFTTTGKAGYCSSDSFCVPCRRDADCRDAYGANAACAVCMSCEHGTAYVQPDDIL